MQWAGAVLVTDDRQHQGTHNGIVVDVDTLVRLHAQCAADRTDISLGIVFVLWCPTPNELPHSAEPMFVLVGDQRAGDRADAPFGADKLDEGRIGLSPGAALPTRADGVTDIAGVVVADAAGLLRTHGGPPVCMGQKRTRRHNRRRVLGRLLKRLKMRWAIAGPSSSRHQSQWRRPCRGNNEFPIAR
ncbi:hypothetical protein FQZ97_948090 [compost metagenome]